MARRRTKASKSGTSLNARWTAMRPALVAGAWAATLIGAALALGMGVPVLRAEEPARGSRLALCRLCADTLGLGLGLLGIETLERM